MKSYNKESWYKLVKELYELISSEIDNVSLEHLPEVYPKLVIMYEFFRLLRGEAFYSVRPPMPEVQREIYKMEDDLANKLKILSSKLNTSDDKTLYYLNMMKTSFDLGYFDYSKSSKNNLKLFLRLFLIILVLLLLLSLLNRFIIIK